MYHEPLEKRENYFEERAERLLRSDRRPRAVTRAQAEAFLQRLEEKDHKTLEKLQTLHDKYNAPQSPRKVLDKGATADLFKRLTS